MKKRIIGTITLVTVMLSAFIHGDVRSEYKTTKNNIKPVVKIAGIYNNADPLSRSTPDRANLSQGDGGE